MAREPMRRVPPKDIALADGMVAHRLVMRAETWAQCEAVAAELARTRGVEVTPHEVAVIVLELGLSLKEAPVGVALCLFCGRDADCAGPLRPWLTQAGKPLWAHPACAAGVASCGPVPRDTRDAATRAAAEASPRDYDDPEHPLYDGGKR